MVKLQKALMPLMVANAMLSSCGGGDYNEPQEEVVESKPLKLTRGYEHKGKSQEKLLQHKLHQQKLRAKRNAKKGIHENQIKHPRNRASRKG